MKPISLTPFLFLFLLAGFAMACGDNSISCGGEADLGPCANATACADTAEGYECTCEPGWTGGNCDVDIDECDGGLGVCVHASECTNTDGAYECTCEATWGGTNCDSRPLRLSALTIQAPEFGPSCSTGLTDILNDLISDAIESDGNDSGTLLDISLTLDFDSFVSTSSGIIGTADCTEANACVSQSEIAGVEFANRTEGSCSIAEGDATVEAGDHGCFEGSATTEAELFLKVLTLPLEDLEVIGRFGDAALTEVLEGSIRGFMSVETAENTLIPADLPAAGGDPLMDILCIDDAVLVDGVQGFEFELSFEADLTTVTE